MRAELSTRPTVKQWTLKLKELSESEAKRLDLVAIRRDSVELLAEREKEREKEREREKVLTDKDKRNNNNSNSHNNNHDVDLWVLDSLPLEVTKNALKAVCRELGLDDVGDIQPSLIKLKAVVGAVPRMERFITQVRLSSLHQLSNHADMMWCDITRGDTMCHVIICHTHALPSTGL